tara:strand:- start:274 stop:909 length:636 start_codon:yes stop_codon:yes gene_type:complete
MFFARQKTNQCGLHAIQNLFKSAKITESDMHDACKDIHEKTGDMISNHESFGGDWSVEAVLQTVVKHGYSIEPGICSKSGRQWSGAHLSELIEDDKFRGMIVHQPRSHHFTCLRPETGPDGTHLYYVDSQSDGPRRISPNLASRRCLAEAYSWEPYIVKGPEMDYVSLSAPALTDVNSDYRESKRRPGPEFMSAWYSLSNSPPVGKNPKKI